MSTTQYRETEALLRAIEDNDADSGNTEATDAYLEANFTDYELRKLAYAADLLSDRASAALKRRSIEALRKGAA